MYSLTYFISLQNRIPHNKNLKELKRIHVKWEIIYCHFGSHRPIFICAKHHTSSYQTHTPIPISFMNLYMEYIECWMQMENINGSGWGMVSCLQYRISIENVHCKSKLFRFVCNSNMFVCRYFLSIFEHNTEITCWLIGFGAPTFFFVVSV